MKIYVREYCFGQRCFHFAELSKSIETNKETIKRIMAIKNDDERNKWLRHIYIPFAIGAEEEVRFALDQMREHIKTTDDWKNFINPDLLL